MSKILIIEDEIALRSALSIKLKKEGFEVLEAQNGQQGLDLAKTQKPDLVLLDIIMPGMNGLDVLKAMKANAGLLNMFVIVLTNLPEESAKEKVKELGGTEYLVKSNIPIEDLVTKIKSYLSVLSKNVSTK